MVDATLASRYPRNVENAQRYFVPSEKRPTTVWHRLLLEGEHLTESG